MAESVGNQIFWRQQVVSINSILRLSTGESMQMDFSSYLNKYTSPSPEDECIAMETIMEQTIDFTHIKDLNASPIAMSQTALDLLVTTKTTGDILQFAEYLNGHGTLTVEAAKKFIEDHPTTPPLNVVEILAEAKYTGNHISRCIESANRLVSAVLRAAYWVALMTRDNSGGIDNTPPTYDEVKRAMGTGMGYTAYFYNRDIEDRDETRRGLSGSQWNILEGNADQMISMLDDLKGWIQDGFNPTVDKQQAFETVIENNTRNKQTRALAAEATRLKQQAAAEKEVAAIVESTGF